MEYTTLGSTGTKVSQICLGTWRFAKETDGVVETDREEAHELLDTAREQGVNFIDTANVYGSPSGESERYIGEWLDDHDREQFVLASKVYGEMDGSSPNGQGLSRKHIRNQIEGTLDRLGTDYLDLYYIHRWDENTPIRETLTTLDDLVRDGKVNYLGASMMATWRLATALWTSEVRGVERFEVTQPRFNAVYRGDAPYRCEPHYEVNVDHYLDFCAEYELAVCPYSPLEGGFLTGKYERNAPQPSEARGELETWDDRFAENQWAVLNAVRSVADELGASPAQVAVQWIIRHDEPDMYPIVGARTPEQLRENVGAVEISLSDDQFRRITEAY